MQLAKKF